MSPIFRSRKSERNVRAADRRRSCRCRSSSKTSVSATSCRPAAPSLNPCESRPCATTTAAPRVDSARSMLTATTSYSRSSSIVRSARPVVATTNTMVSRRSRARRMSATQSWTRPRYSAVGCTSTLLAECTGTRARRGRSSGCGIRRRRSRRLSATRRRPTRRRRSRCPARPGSPAPRPAVPPRRRPTGRRRARVPRAGLRRPGARRCASHGSAIDVGSGAIGFRSSASA